MRGPIQWAINRYRKNKMPVTLWYLDERKCSTNLYVKLIAGSEYMFSNCIEPNFVWYKSHDIWVKKGTTLPEIFVHHGKSKYGELSIGDVIELHGEDDKSFCWYADKYGEFIDVPGFFDPSY